MSSALDNIREQLQAELDIAEAEVGRLAEEHAAAQRDHKSIKDALSALGRPGKGAKKPAFKKADVIKHLAKLLSKMERPVKMADLEATLRETAAMNGYAATGLQLRLNEAVKDSRFRETEEGISLTAKVNATA